MSVQFSTYNYTPLFNLKKTDFIDLRTNLEDFIPLGEDNLLPTQLNKLAREVPVHRAILNSKTNYVVGKGLASINFSRPFALPSFFFRLLSSKLWMNSEILS